MSDVEPTENAVDIWSYGTYYHSLKVAVTASPEEVSAAYAALCVESETRIGRCWRWMFGPSKREVDEAYSVLGNAQLRIEYDALQKRIQRNPFYGVPPPG